MQSDLNSLFQNAFAASQRGDWDEASRRYEMLLNLLPKDHPLYHSAAYNYSWFEFRDGRFQSAHRHRIESGRHLRIIHDAANTYAQPRLTEKTSLHGQRVLISSECGAGDEIILSRYAQCLKDLGAETIWLSRKGLESVLARVEGIDRTVTENDVPTLKFDCWIFALDLLLLFGDDPRKDKQPYLVASSDKTLKFQRQLRPGKNLKVGLRWQGDAGRDRDLNRNIPFNYLEQLTQIPGIDFYSLQRDSGIEEIREGSGIVDWSRELATWEDTLGAMSNLDLIITSCTSIAHAAAALGIETLVLGQSFCYYTWTAKEKYQCYWYKTATPFLCAIGGTWQEPINEINSLLERKTGQTAVIEEGIDILTAKFPQTDIQMAVHRRPEMVSQIIRGQKYYTRRDLNVLKGLLRPGDTFVDIGANLGWYTLYGAMCVGERGRVLAIEPAPENLLCLQKTLSINHFKQVEVLPAGVGEDDGEAWLYSCVENSGDHAVTLSSAGMGSRSKVKIPIRKLDHLLQEKNLNPRLIKIDIQGAEAAAFEGMGQWLRNHRPFILMEYAPGLIRRFGSSPFEIFAFLEKYAYVPVWVPDEYSPENEMRPFDIVSFFNFTKENLTTDVGFDFLLVPDKEMANLRINFTRGVS